MIAGARGRKIVLVKGFGWAMKLLGKFIGLVDKAFGNLCYEQRMSVYPEKYQIYSLAESIRETEHD